jgi:hypothetical protein
MDIEKLTRMDTEADKIIESFADPSKCIENYTIMRGDRLNKVYGSALTPDQLDGYGWMAGQWIIEQGAGMLFGIAVSKVGGALKQAYRDRASGKEAPKPEEFRKYILHVEGGVYAITGAKATLTVTHKDGSVDSR